MTDPMQGRVLGIEVSNVIIPDEIKDEVEGWEIFYAERGMNDMTRISQSILVNNEYDGHPSIPSKYANFHGFDLMVSGINVGPTHTETQYGVLLPAINPTAKVNRVSRNLQLMTVSPSWNKIINSRYVDANFTSDDPTINNRYKEQALRVQFDQLFATTYYSVVDLCAIKNNVFFDYHIQKPVSTGIIYPVTATSATMFGGDTYLSQYTIHLFKPDDTGVIKTINNVKSTVYPNRMPYTITIPVYSTFNIGFRTEGSAITEKLYPKTNAVLTTEFPTRVIYFGYNQVYTGLNDVTKVIVRPRFDTFTNNFPNRLHLSLKPSDESIALNWRTFLAGDYKTIPFSKGKIIGVQVQGNQVIIACEYSTFKIGIKDVLTTENFDAYLKRGELFDRPVEELVKTNDGYIGTKHKFAMTTNELGTFIVDTDKRKIYIISDGLKELTKDGYVNEMNGVLDMTSTSFPDNPFFLWGVTLCIDRVNDRLLLLVNKQYTSSLYSYSYTNNCWVSEHIYLNETGYSSRALFSNRNGAYLIYSNIAEDLTGSSKVVKINPRLTDTKTAQARHHVEAILGDNLPTKKLYQSIMWSTHTDDLKQDVTFTLAQIWAANQGTVQALVTEVSARKYPVGGNIQNIKGLWVFGNIIDQVANQDIATFSRGYGYASDNLIGYEVGSDLHVNTNTYYKVVNLNNTQPVVCEYDGATYTEDMVFKTNDIANVLTSKGLGASVQVFKPYRTISRIVNDHLIVCLVTT